jgi:hypothetical protein
VLSEVFREQLFTQLCVLTMNVCVSAEDATAAWYCRHVSKDHLTPTFLSHPWHTMSAVSNSCFKKAIRWPQFWVHGKWKPSFRTWYYEILSSIFEQTDRFKNIVICPQLENWFLVARECNNFNNERNRDTMKWTNERKSRHIQAEERLLLLVMCTEL